MTNRKQKYLFSKDYFDGYFKGIGDFSLKRNDELYNWFMGMFDYLNRYIPLKEGKSRTAIEYGCAVGAASKVLYDWGWKVTATDLTNYPLNKARKIYPSIEFKTHDIQKPYISSKFDFAFAFDVIEHLEKPQVAIKNMFDVIKKNGFVVCSTPNDQANVFDDPSHINVHEPGYWHRLFTRVGFRKVILRQVTFLPYFYRIHWKLNIALPLGIASPYFTSPVFIIAKK